MLGCDICVAGGVVCAGISTILLYRWVFEYLSYLSVKWSSEKCLHCIIAPVQHFALISINWSIQWLTEVLLNFVGNYIATHTDVNIEFFKLHAHCQSHHVSVIEMHMYWELNNSLRAFIKQNRLSFFVLMHLH